MHYLSIEIQAINKRFSEKKKAATLDLKKGVVCRSAVPDRQSRVMKKTSVVVYDRKTTTALELTSAVGKQATAMLAGFLNFNQQKSCRIGE